MVGWWWSENINSSNEVLPSESPSPSNSSLSSPLPPPDEQSSTPPPTVHPGEPQRFRSRASPPPPESYVNSNSPFRILEAQARERERQDKTDGQSVRYSAMGHLDTLNRDEETALAELRAAFGAELDIKTSKPSKTESAARVAAATHEQREQAKSAWSETKKARDAQREEEENSLYPPTLSCSACFDAAYLCSSLSGQMTNLYRYGALRSCSDLWAQWRFCMRTKTMGEEERRRRIREWNRMKEARRRLGKSSEAVWALRTDGPPDGALGMWEAEDGKEAMGET